MRRLTLFALSAAALGFGACTTTSGEAPALVAAASGAPLPVEGYDWHFNADRNEAQLAYGVAESDDLKLGMGCRKNSGRLTLTAAVDEGAAPEFYLESGGDTERFPAEKEPAQVNDGAFLTAEARTSEPVFLRFRRVGWLAAWQGEARETYVPHPGSAPQIEQFFAFCG